MDKKGKLPNRGCIKMLCHQLQSSTDGYFKEESKNKSLKITTEVHLPGDTEQEDKNIEFYPNLITETVLWTTGGIFTILGLILAICCIRRKCHRNTQEPTSFKAQLSTERLHRPQACVRPFINDAVSNHEGNRPLIPPGVINALSGQLDHHVEYSPGQALSHAIDVQDTVTDYLRPAPDMDLNSFDNDDRSQSNDFGENVNRITRTIPIESPNQSTISFNNEEI
ncbi:uncharacterized protein LOC133191633 [Saccostrea echinata]|uniref:uncharacterized protein LOC133191633 n=1 Tax=Saccostrea echinata TaxID=191078 RepID=UPI002A8019E5|nr:uncharacterized protein LOC133191633 [Saccostrea echinata]